MRIRHLRTALAVAGFLCASPLWPQTAVRPEFAPVTDDPALPRVLLIGDSISIGYTLAVREHLRGVANVHRPPENCGATERGLEKIERWLGTGRWDLIHFNWGLHDLKYLDGNNQLALPPRGKQVASPEEYGRNLEKLVLRLKKTAAALLWRPTTPVPEGAAGRYPADAPRYNEVALRIMRRHGVAVDDLNAFIAARKIPHVQPDNVHFSADSSEMLGRHIAEVIRGSLGARKPAR
ncbi:MAG: SGNH/GDSL hydrolase family protein [Bryobacteraceae bacterium]